jgi:trk system potassium uptake protein TrkA
MGLRIAILGLGDFGCELAKVLIELRAEVIAVDKDTAQVQTITPLVNKAVVADITKRQALEEIGIDTVDVAVIATAEPFEATVLAAHHLRELKVPLVMAKVANTDQAKILSLMGVAQTINPEMESAVRTAHLIAYPRVRDYMELGEDYFVVRVEAIESVAGQTVEAIRKKFKLDVIALRPADRSSGFKGVSHDQVVAAGDELLLVGPGDRFLNLKKVK